LLVGSALDESRAPSRRARDSDCLAFAGSAGFSRRVRRVPEQPLQLTGVGVVSFEDGSFGLELLLDEGLRLFVAIPSESIAALRDGVNVIDTLDGAMTDQSAGMTQH
jgi:hypothetical protein